MRRIIFCIILLLTAIMGFPKVTKPDFAFPATVAKDAYADLKKANALNDAHAALNALIRVTVAENLIDEDSLASAIKLVEQTALKYQDDKLYGLFPALTANLYATYYNRNRWIFDRRQTPLEPYPTDISEWSGKQFQTKIVDILKEGISEKNDRDLKQLSVKDYTDLIAIGELTTTYYPTLFDFYVANAVEVANFDEEYRESIMIGASMEHGRSTDGETIHESAPSVMWMWRALSSKTGNFDDIFKTVNKLKDNKYAGIVFAEVPKFIQNNNIEEVRKYTTLASEYIEKFSDSPFKNVIKEHIENLTSSKVYIEMVTYCSPGHAFDVKLHTLNAKDISLNVYYAGDKPINVNYRKLYSSLLAKKPVKTMSLKFNETVPFKSDTTLSLSLDKTGYYYVIPVLSNKKVDAYLVNMVRCIPVYPFSVCTEMIADVITVDPYTGKPMADVGITLTNRYGRNVKDTVNCGKTDRDGIVNVFDKLKDNNGFYVTATTGEKSFEFDNLSVYRNVKQTREVEYNAEVLTDRRLYHPGDNTELLVVMSEALPDSAFRMQQRLCENRDIRVMLKDANYQTIDTVDVTTDDWGRATATFKLPTDGLTGYYSIEVSDKTTDRSIGSQSIMVSDYRMPDFEIKIDETACDEPSKGFVTIRGTATSYSGMPMADAAITLNLSESSWGWWRWHNQGAKIYTKEITADAKGKFTFVVPDSVLTDRKRLYMADIEGVSVTGSTAQTSTAFTLSKKYDITVNIKGGNIDGEKPFRPDVKVYAPDGSTVEIPLEWALVHDNDTTAYQPFNGEIDLSKTKPAIYNLVIRSVDAEIADPASAQITVYNKSTGIVPEDCVLWVPKTSYKAGTDGEAEIMYANAFDDTYIYCYITNDDNTERPLVIKAKKGYNTLKLKMADGAQTTALRLYTVRNEQFNFIKISLKRDTNNSLKITGESFRDNLIPGAKETWKIRISDSNDIGCQSALVLDMYNRALEALSSQHQSLWFQTYEYTSRINAYYPYSSFTNCIYSQSATPAGKNVSVFSPEFNFYGRLNSFGNIRLRGTYMKSMASVESGEEEVLYETTDTYDDAIVMEAPAMAGGAINGSMNMSMADLEFNAPTEAEGVVATAEDIYISASDAPASTDEAFDYRDSDVPMAIWAPMLTTDKDGGICYTFTVPNANTTWRLQAVAWSRDLEVGSLIRDFVASKPVMVQPNLPRFLRNGDEATVVASVMNNSDKEQEVTTTVEIFNPLTGYLMKTKTFVQTIGPKGYDKVSVKIAVEDDTNAIGYRVRSTNGDFSDGEQSVIRVLPSEQALIETEPFYLNPGEKEFSTTLPSDEGARISLTFCENPAWTIVSALPGLRTEIQDYANSAAAAMYSSAISRGIVKDNPKIGDVVKAWLDNPEDSALVSMLEKNESLKIAVLNATPWVISAQNQNERMANLAMIFDDKANANTIDAAIKILKDLQNSDGGWAWGKWCRESSVWATSNVLAMIGDLRRIGWMPANKELTGMIDRAVKYYDNKVEDTDLLYCLVRPLFSSEVGANGKSVINATLRDIKKNWKKYSDPAYKAMAAQALYLNGDKATAHELMKSLSEFGVFTKDQGLKFPNVNALYEYAIILSAYSTIEPGSKEVDGLRQQLIVRKQATDWGSAVVTMEVVKAILTSGSNWTVEADGAEIAAGDHRIEPSGAVEKATGSLTADLSDYAGKELTVTTSGSGPAYGAVYSQFNRTMNEVKSSGCADLDIEKQLFVRRGTEWAVADTLAVGDRVKVQLTIHCKRNMQYMAIVDERPAAFEPVEQLPGWMWSEGVGFYRENRDSQTDLHVVYMSPGTYLLTYEMNVGLGGTFSSGVASIQSLYAPELSAHSSGCIIRVAE